MVKLGSLLSPATIKILAWLHFYLLYPHESARKMSKPPGTWQIKDFKSLHTNYHYTFYNSGGWDLKIVLYLLMSHSTEIPSPDTVVPFSP